MAFPLALGCNGGESQLTRKELLGVRFWGLIGAQKKYLQEMIEALRRDGPGAIPPMLEYLALLESLLYETETKYYGTGKP